MIGTAKSSPARVSLDGVEIVYDTFGDPAYPPLLLIAGLANQMIALALAIHHPKRVRSLILGMSTIDPRRRSLPRPKTWPLFWSAPRCWEAYLAHFLRVKRLLSGPRFPLDEADARQLAWQLYERCPQSGWYGAPTFCHRGQSASVAGGTFPGYPHTDHPRSGRPLATRGPCKERRPGYP